MFIIPNYFLCSSYSDHEYYTILMFCNKNGSIRTIIDLKYILITTINHLDVHEPYKFRLYEMESETSECIPITN